MNIKKSLLFISVVIALAGCYNDKYDKLYPIPPTKPNVNPCDTTAVSYGTTILPILTANCNLSGCHDGSGAGRNYTTYNGVIRDTVRMVSYLTGASGDPMPKNLSPLSSCNIAKIRAWIAQGALNN